MRSHGCHRFCRIFMHSASRVAPSRQPATVGTLETAPVVGARARRSNARFEDRFGTRHLLFGSSVRNPEPPFPTDSCGSVVSAADEPTTGPRPALFSVAAAARARSAASVLAFRGGPRWGSAKRSHRRVPTGLGKGGAHHISGQLGACSSVSIATKPRATRARPPERSQINSSKVEEAEVIERLHVVFILPATTLCVAATDRRLSHPEGNSSTGQSRDDVRSGAGR